MNYNKIKVELEKRKITIRDFCHKVGITEQGLHQMVRNESMKVDVLEKISEVLGVPVSYWFEENDYKVVEPQNSLAVKEEGKKYKKATDMSTSIDAATATLNKLLRELLSQQTK